MGVRYRIVGSGRELEQFKLSQGLKVVNETTTSYSGKLDATVTVLHDGDNSDGSKLRLVVSTCKYAENGKSPEKEIVPAGTEILAELQGKEEVFLMNGKPVSPEVKKVMNLFFSLRNDKTTDDDVFGTKERKKVGDRWPVHHAEMATSLAEVGILAKADSIKGSTALDKIVETDGIKALRITGNVEVENLTSPAIPPEFIVDKANAFVYFSGDFPIDTTKPPLSDKMDMTMWLTGRGSAPNGIGFVLSMRMEQTVEKKYKALQ
ncbi:hypothetical protein [Geomonas sp. Red276]